MKIRVGLFFGGKSVEHEVSVISGIQALHNIDRERFDVTPIYITKDSEFYAGTDIGNIESYRDIPALLSRSDRVNFVRDSGHVYMLRYPPKRFGDNRIAEFDVALPVVHGTNCEDGSLQGLFTMLGLPFAGSGVAASAVGMDKFIQKSILKEHGIPVLDAVCVTRTEYEEGSVALAAERIGFPLIVKPINLGSSVGISIAHDEAAYTQSLDLAFSFADTVIVERAITELKEINCAVLGDFDSVQTSECEEPLGADEILSYSDKYMSGGKGAAKGGAKSEGMASLGRKIPADISDEQRATVFHLAEKAFKALGCSGVARIDFMLEVPTGQIYFNEINTIPGSLAFYLWEATGMSYKEQLSEMINLALRRERRERGLAHTFDTNILAGAKSFGSKGKV